MLITVIVLLGVSVSLAGCYLPWGYVGTILLYNYVPVSRPGIPYIKMAAYILPTCILTLFLSAIFILRPRRYTGLLVLCGSLATLSMIGAWIALPSLRIIEPRLGLEWPFNTYSILYGAYVTLTGAIITSIASVLQLYVAVKRPIKNAS